MAITLVDSSVLLDVLTDDQEWAGWSADALAKCADKGELAIDPIVYAEVSVRFTTIEALEEALPRALFRRASIPWEAGFLAGKAFLRYRRDGGSRTAPLPDFLIGSHASVRGWVLLTRDPARVRRHFPKLTLVSPS